MAYCVYNYGIVSTDANAILSLLTQMVSIISTNNRKELDTNYYLISMHESLHACMLPRVAFSFYLGMILFCTVEI